MPLNFCEIGSWATGHLTWAGRFRHSCVSSIQIAMECVTKWRRFCKARYLLRDGRQSRLVLAVVATTLSAARSQWFLQAAKACTTCTVSRDTFRPRHLLHRTSYVACAFQSAQDSPRLSIRCEIRTLSSVSLVDSVSLPPAVSVNYASPHQCK